MIRRTHNHDNNDNNTNMIIITTIIMIIILILLIIILMTNHVDININADNTTNNIINVVLKQLLASQPSRPPISRSIRRSPWPWASSRHGSL